MGGKEGETKSEYNFPLGNNKARKNPEGRMKEPTLGENISMVKRNYLGEFEREGVQSMVGGMSMVEMEVYKEGYNKLKDKYRKEAETARTELNKRMSLESSENILKLETMKLKLKNEELEKNLSEKTIRIK